MPKQINIQDSVSIHPNGSTGTTNMSASSQYPSTNALTDSNSDKYARFSVTTSATGETYFTFDTPTLPNGAAITSITATVKVYVSSTTRVTNTRCQLYSGTTAKGSNYTFASTSNTNVVSMTNTGTWTTSELANMRLKIGGTGSSSNQSKYIYVYGATVVINYSIQGTEYSITATSAVPHIEVDPTTQNIFENNNASLISFYVDDITDYIVTDNNIDITSQLIKHEIDKTGTISATASSYTTGTSTSGINFYTSSSSQTNNFNYAVGHTAESPGSTASGSGSWTYVKSSSGSTTATGWAEYSFDFSNIPINATITSVEVKCYGAIEDSSQTTSHSEVSLYSGTTQKGSTQSFTSNTNSIMTISSPGTWTREELQSAKLRFIVGYYGGHLFGITWNVSYEIQTNNDYYYTYALSNINADHIILLDYAGVYIPPEEDPEYTYWPITISSINATTNPATGTTRVIEGTNQTITITPSDPQLTLALDNGVDITSQLQGGAPSNTYTVTNTVSGASYGFTLNSSTGYYVSGNAGQSNSAAVCRVNFDCESDCLVTIQYINYAEGTYDYGIFGQIDTALGTTSTADSNTYLSCSTSSYNTSSTQTVTYNLTAGTHFIDIKYRKDSYTDSNNDNLQWKIISIEAIGTSGSYTYTLSNITQKHSLIFVFGNVSYYFITSSGTNCRLFPDGQQVKLEGESYKINIIPDNITDIVSLTDNNVNQVLTKEEGVDKNNNPVVSYNYTITNIQTAHTLVVSSTVSSQLFIKSQGSWVPVVKLYLKQDDRWIEQELTYISDNNITKLKQGS